MTLEWEPIIGLEIHAQLNTRTKLFSPAPNRFGDEPNTNISAVCTGQPGALPVLNKEAVRKAVQFGLAAKAKINLVTRFDRKSYFYPDSPRGYQITQFEKPLLTGGSITAMVEGQERMFGLSHAHLEDDAGTLKHFSDFTGIDYNRAGAPLIEIVTLPCLHSAKEASALATAVRTLLLYLEISDCNMEEGSYRIDANISVRSKRETTLRPRTEVKNVNSFHFLEAAIDMEIKRQIKLYESHPTLPAKELMTEATYRWDPEKKECQLLRNKESAEDYRYFPDPDLVPLVLTQDYVDWIERTLPELPHERYHRYVSDLGLSEQAASTLVHDKSLSDFFEEALKSWVSPRLLCNWLITEFAGRLSGTGKTLQSLQVRPAHVAKLIRLIETGAITGRIAKRVADEMIEQPGQDPERIVSNNPDYHPMSQAVDIEPIIEQVLSEHPYTVEDFQSGKEKALDFLVGQVMKHTRGKASPQVVHELLLKKIRG